MYVNDIPGYVAFTQLEWLKEQAEKMDSIVEIGCWKGRSTHALCTGCKGMVYTVDTFEGNKGEEEYFLDKAMAYEDCKHNLKDFRNVEIHKIIGHEASQILPNVDMVWIDGNHTYEGVKQDIEDWLPKAKKLICGHDIGRECIVKAVKETVGDYQVFENIWYKIL